MYWFGKSLGSNGDLLAEENWASLTPKRIELACTPLNEILDLLDIFSREDFSEALPGLIAEASFSPDETRKTLELLPSLLKRDVLEKRIRAEFTNFEVLDRFAKIPHGQFKVRAVPQGILLHVTAGNVFLSSIDSLIMGFVTKNLSILKVSSTNKFFPSWFASKLEAFDKKKVLADKFAVVYWKGGDEKTESAVKQRVNTIIGWGGEEMIASYRRHLPAHVKFLDFGPKISIQLISKEGLSQKKLSEVADRIVADVVPWDQSACASPQNLYLQEGINEEVFLKTLETQFQKAPARGALDADEAVELLKERFRGYWSELMEGGKLLEGEEHLLHLEENRLLKPSPLHRSLIIKRFRDEQELFELLTPFAWYLQSCSYLLHEKEKERYLGLLSLTGIKRFAPVGTITWGMEGAPHDGRFVLRELVTFIGDEVRAQNFTDTISAPLGDSKNLKANFEAITHPRGYIFSSGGTTGEPKYVHFSYEEFDFMSDMLAENLKAQGVRAGMTVANLFVAGNLWSSFLCVDKALEKIGAIQLPIGGLCSTANILSYLKKFRPDVVMGIPSMLVLNAEEAVEKGIDLEIPMIFYAGEALSEVRRSYLEQIWKTKYFGSAGYASVDAGVIGYQCSHCGPGEHHVFEDLVQLELVEGEGVVTSLARNSMALQRYRTGDKMEWISNCGCGRKDRRFRLLGRIDNIVQLWSCRLLISDVESGLAESGVMTFQLKVSEMREGQKVREILTLVIERPEQAIDQEMFLRSLYERSRDVRDTISYEDFRENIELIEVGVGQIPRNERTGKISLLMDLRK